MINTPIWDFVKKYAQSNAVRLHMPGHKGQGETERYDITEISGADSLYEANGIIKESENNASMLFGAHTFFSAEGSSLSIRAMMYMITLYAADQKKRPLVLAGRNAHKAFVCSAALADFDVEWIQTQNEYLSGKIDAKTVENSVKKLKDLPVAVYLTTPDYLGNRADIADIAKFCHKVGILLVVDNAHGAYLKFLPRSEHPIDLGADICCDSAHKTLPVLTGGAYLHISKNAPEFFLSHVKTALALFGSTSPSYLILASLDRANAYIKNGYAQKLNDLINKIAQLKNKISQLGYSVACDEPMKITITPKSYGYCGDELAEIMLGSGIVCEFADVDHIVFMTSVHNTDNDLEKLYCVLSQLPKRKKIESLPPIIGQPKRMLPIRKALFSNSCTLPTSQCEGRILAAVTVGCPPAVPIVVSGELIDKNAIAAFEYYGIKELSVIA